MSPPLTGSNPNHWIHSSWKVKITFNFQFAGNIHQEVETLNVHHTSLREHARYREATELLPTSTQPPLSSSGINLFQGLYAWPPTRRWRSPGCCARCGSRRAVPALAIEAVLLAISAFASTRARPAGPRHVCIRCRQSICVRSCATSIVGSDGA